MMRGGVGTRKAYSLLLARLKERLVSERATSSVVVIMAAGTLQREWRGDRERRQRGRGSSRREASGQGSRRLGGSCLPGSDARSFRLRLRAGQLSFWTWVRMGESAGRCAANSAGLAENAKSHTRSGLSRSRGQRAHMRSETLGPASMGRPCTPTSARPPIACLPRSTPPSPSSLKQPPVNLIHMLKSQIAPLISN